VWAMKDDELAEQAKFTVVEVLVAVASLADIIASKEWALRSGGCDGW
jgi:hypothetical protein